MLDTTPSVRSEYQHLNECIGAVDGKLIVIQKPSLFGNSWLDQHSNVSMALMAVCDHKKRFTDIRVGLAILESCFVIQDHTLLEPESMAKVITTCCILHNMCITFGNSKVYLEELLRADGASFEAHDADNDDEDFEDPYAEMDNSCIETETASERRFRRDQVKDTL
ncbi:hypothetical protein PHYBLDRAFT_151983 [Phycomyces blakesleeanus NRRL 1555(-)]|uniref:DDE Tnp4 domain-containing protein n=1 Tax=Phycomyces blakesleeanus (strain ATCC 8743b / DSM 1359 / FGSC 10004 / NBRC 33097 / NRRL 1555) TaxID=763407 RepID=A0A167K128_PHYB8|nr:hypothetical protein PHYBLDRAFT_151983 [Phycomyces blakesleeanus NRRL 1555(-)]OAD67038.1 hypothetical protein PHYBLDRAFT_151983 [Phycomyces blakesleeanus NRRL 1555(-)]|eukprot:XP_018285078.1 hypothetical protein PHYBLDRAFT_151983 [Phycomyces blakesleeanus NRRL 1555(-)]